MREWRIKSDWSENISSDSILEGTHYCYEPMDKVKGKPPKSTMAQTDEFC
jgi:hypothetical protein